MRITASVAQRDGAAILAVPPDSLVVDRILRRDGATICFAREVDGAGRKFVVKYPRREAASVGHVVRESARYDWLLRNGPRMDDVQYIRVHGSDERSGCIVMDHFSGASLAERLREMAAWPGQEGVCLEAAERVGSWLALLQSQAPACGPTGSFESLCDAAVSSIKQLRSGGRYRIDQRGLILVIEEYINNLDAAERRTVARLGVCHGDLAASNIIVRDDGVVCPFDPGKRCGQWIPGRDVMRFRLSLLHLAARNPFCRRRAEQVWSRFWRAYSECVESLDVAALVSVSAIAHYCSRYENAGRRVRIGSAAAGIVAAWDTARAYASMRRFLGSISERGRAIECQLELLC